MAPLGNTVSVTFSSIALCVRVTALPNPAILAAALQIARKIDNQFFVILQVDALVPSELRDQTIQE